MYHEHAATEGCTDKIGCIGDSVDVFRVVLIAPSHGACEGIHDDQHRLAADLLLDVYDQLSHPAVIQQLHWRRQDVYRYRLFDAVVLLPRPNPLADAPRTLGAYVDHWAGHDWPTEPRNTRHDTERPGKRQKRLPATLARIQEGDGVFVEDVANNAACRQHLLALFIGQ